MREDIGTYTCSDSVENVSKFSWKSRSRDGSSRGGDRRSDLPSDRANLDQVDMELDSENSESLLKNEAMSIVSSDLANSGILLGEALSSNLSMVDS